MEVPVLLRCWTVEEDVLPHSLRSKAKGAGVVRSTPYPVHVAWERWVMPTAESRQVDSVISGEIPLRRIHRRGSALEEGVPRCGAEGGPSHLTVYVSAFGDFLRTG